MTEYGVCYHIYFSGHVQGVGFRWRSKQIAESYSVGGWVKNLPDGRVEMLVNGVKPEVEAYLQNLQRELSSNISNESLQLEEYKPDMQQFSIKF